MCYILPLANSTLFKFYSTKAQKHFNFPEYNTLVILLNAHVYPIANYSSISLCTVHFPTLPQVDCSRQRAPTFSIQHLWNVEVLLCNLEGQVEVVHVITLRKTDSLVEQTCTTHTLNPQTQTHLIQRILREYLYTHTTHHTHTCTVSVSTNRR